MLGFLKDWILNIAALVLFIVIIEMLMPSGRMKKYCGLVTGVILIIAIINPFLKFFSGNLNFDDIQVTNSNFIDRLEIEKNSKLLKEEQMKQITEVYRKKIIKQLEDSARKSKGVYEAKGDVIINEDYNSESFGEIKRVYLEINTSGDKSDIRPVAKVEQVIIGKDMSEVEKSTEVQRYTEVDPKLRKQLEDDISTLFNVSKENIIIMQYKR